MERTLDNENLNIDALIFTTDGRPPLSKGHIYICCNRGELPLYRQTKSVQGPVSQKFVQTMFALRIR